MYVFCSSCWRVAFEAVGHAAIGRRNGAWRRAKSDRIKLAGERNAVLMLHNEVYREYSLT